MNEIEGQILMNQLTLIANEIALLKSKGYSFDALQDAYEDTKNLLIKQDALDKENGIK